MEEKKKEIFDRVEVIDVTPEDGAVPRSTLEPNRTGRHRGQFYGRGRTYSYTSTNVGVQKVFVRLLTGFLILMALGFLCMGVILLPCVVIAFTLFCYKKLMGDIEKRAAEQQVHLPETEEEIHEVEREVGGTLKAGFREIARETFTVETIRRFKKLAGILYLAIGIPLTGILLYLDRFTGILVGICLVAAGIAYNLFLDWLVRISQK